ADPAANKDSLVVVTFGNRPGASWTGKILGNRNNVVSLGITAHPKAIVGLYRIYVAVSVGNGMQRTEKDPNTNIYMLFNPWCPDDDVFYPDDTGRMEYVLNSTGLIYQGTAEHVGERGWVYGQGFAGEPLKIALAFHNQGDLMKSVKAHMEISVTYYTGVVSSDPFKIEDFSLYVEPYQSERSTKVFDIPPQEYMSHLGPNSSLEISVIGQTDNEEVSEVKSVSLKLPPLNVTVNSDMFVIVSFTNTLNFPLTGAKLAMEGAGLLETQVYNYRPQKPGLRTLLLVLDCENLPDVTPAVTGRSTSWQRYLMNQHPTNWSFQVVTCKRRLTVLPLELRGPLLAQNIPQPGVTPKSGKLLAC
ncbi:hypothetical protein GOODEAATRI_014614, partial [Goodea atripinnis]